MVPRERRKHSIDDIDIDDDECARWCVRCDWHGFSPRHSLAPASDVDVARDIVRVRYPVGVWDDAAVPRRGVVRAMRGVRSRHGDDWATRIGAEWWIQWWPRSARVGVGVVVVVDGDE